MNVMDHELGIICDAEPKAIDVNQDGKYTLAWWIGIKGHCEDAFICFVYDNDEFNRRFTVVKWSRAKQKYIPETEYKFWIDDQEEVTA